MPKILSLITSIFIALSTSTYAEAPKSFLNQFDTQEEEERLDKEIEALEKETENYFIADPKEKDLIKKTETEKIKNSLEKTEVEISEKLPPSTKTKIKEVEELLITQDKEIDKKITENKNKPEIKIDDIPVTQTPITDDIFSLDASEFKIEEIDDGSGDDIAIENITKTPQEKKQETAQKLGKHKHRIKSSKIMAAHQATSYEIDIPKKLQKIKVRKKPSTPQYSYKKPYNLYARKQFDNNNSHINPVTYYEEYYYILFSSIEYQRPEGIRAISQKVGPIENIFVQNFSPLTYAVHKGNIDVVRTLLKSGYNPNLLDANGAAPIHYAAIKKDYNLLAELIYWNADTNLKDNNNRTALDIATEQSDYAIMSILETS